MVHYFPVRCIDVHLYIVIDAIMKVSVEVLKRVYETLQDQGERTQIERELIDPEKHLFFIDAFEMPRWIWSPERGTFERLFECIFAIHFLTRRFRTSTPCTWSGTPESRVTSVRDRLNIIRQCVLRNEHFAPSTLPSRDREKLVTVRIGLALSSGGNLIIILAKINETTFGTIWGTILASRYAGLQQRGETLPGRRRRCCGVGFLDTGRTMSLKVMQVVDEAQDEPGDGLFTEGCFALVEGEYTQEATLEIVAIGQPPCEPRSIARCVFRYMIISVHIGYKVDLRSY